MATSRHGTRLMPEWIRSDGSVLKKETLALMKTKGTYLVPTLLASDYIMGKIGAYPQAIQERRRPRPRPAARCFAMRSNSA